jgi:hypothetical protein
MWDDWEDWEPLPNGRIIEFAEENPKAAALAAVAGIAIIGAAFLRSEDASS